VSKPSAKKNRKPVILAGFFIHHDVFSGEEKNRAELRLASDQ